MMLLDHCEAVLAVQSRDEFQRAVVKFACALGCDIVSAAAVYDRPSDRPQFVAVHNTPPSYLRAFMTSPRGIRNPVMQHSKRSGLPLVWDQTTYVRAGLGEFWEDQAAHGYRTGISMAPHLPGGRHFTLGVDRDQFLPGHPEERSRMAASLASFLMYSQETALRVLPPERHRSRRWVGSRRGFNAGRCVALSTSCEPRF